MILLMMRFAAMHGSAVALTGKGPANSLSIALGVAAMVPWLTVAS